MQKLGRLNPSETAEAFLTAALSLDEQRLRALSHPTYADHAITLWIAATDDYANPIPTLAPDPELITPTILVSKVVQHAGSYARIAVFVDATNLGVAAIPYTVELIELNDRWVVIDAGLPTS